MLVEIDPRSGFCFGVVRAIRMAEDQLAKHGPLLCLGDIVHNGEEVARLERLGLGTIRHGEMPTVPGQTLLFRAHGEPPSTYEQAQALHQPIIDATCPVVLQLQRKVKASGERLREVGGQIVIFGKPDHAEVNGLLGQTECIRHVVLHDEDLEALDYTRPTECFSQTTMSPLRYAEITESIRQRMQQALGTSAPPLVVHRTICSQVANRQEQLERFAKAHDAVLFVSGKKSSNGQMLYQHCRNVNARTHFISTPHEVQRPWLDGVETLGVCGATSTPRWLMEQVAEYATRLAEGKSS